MTDQCQPPAVLAPFEKETSGPGVAVASRPPCIEPEARRKKTSAWSPKLLPPDEISG